MKRFRVYLNRLKSYKSKSVQRPPRQHQPQTEQGAGPAATTQAAPAQVLRHDSAQDQSQSVMRTEAAATAGILDIAIRNDTTSSTVFAYITGQALDNGNSVVLMQSDGRTPYYPTNPSSILQPLQANCAIPLGVPGNSIIAQIPRIAGGRIWFSIDTPLTFLLNPGGNGPALVEPSVTNPSDPNFNVDFAFCEFTFNADQLYANISYVDMVSIPVSLTLATVNSGSQYVTGMTSTGPAQIAAQLRAQDATDNSTRWSSLIVPRPNGNSDTPLRILSPNQANVITPGLFAGYFEPYVAAAYAYFATQPITVDTQASFGLVTSTPANLTNLLTLGANTFVPPTTQDIFSCSTGPFATGSDAERNAIIPRLAAAFNRSTILSSSEIPAPMSTYYKDAITNHYARIVHANNVDGRGYAFPYDDVSRSGEGDQSGAVHAGDPTLLIVGVGGGQVGSS